MVNFETLAVQLDASPDYQILRRIGRQEQFHPKDDTPKRKGLLVDVETTGLDVQQDVIIELGCILFEYGLNGTIYRILEDYSGLEDPHQMLDPQIIKLTGITDKDLRNQKLNDVEVIRLIEEADFVIAHNAGFDRPMLERRFHQFASKAWGCSLNSVNWQEEGITSGKLDYILFKLGRFHEGHRAVEDCHATLFALTAELPGSHTSAMAQILRKARDPGNRVFALNAAYEVKDILKARGYKWSDGNDGRAKSWYIDVATEDLQEELEFLLDGKVSGETLPILRLNPLDLYTERVLRLPPNDQWHTLTRE